MKIYHNKGVHNMIQSIEFKHASLELRLDTKLQRKPLMNTEQNSPKNLRHSLITLIWKNNNNVEA